MDTPDPVVALRRLMAADGTPEPIDRGRVEAIWNTRFPADHVRLMEGYGRG